MSPVDAIRALLARIWSAPGPAPEKAMVPAQLDLDALVEGYRQPAPAPAPEPCGCGAPGVTAEEGIRSLVEAHHGLLHAQGRHPWVVYDQQADLVLLDDGRIISRGLAMLYYRPGQWPPPRSVSEWERLPDGRYRCTNSGARS